ncbi:hypothetical protein DPMN_090647 [Dreissena polymorpha]|uniref:Uncharacterized protein n=1 Tax=Dreissena polymorpha TaxID=45954 RepID=A0A9D4KY39_DREPO|nr:hypothetical protein DPMN_090647 [Dreissena polymorpha]
MSVQTLTQTGSQDVSKPGMRDHWSRTPLRRRRSFQRLYRTRSVPTGHFYRKVRFAATCILIAYLIMPK